jgi:hypothetical protein
MQSLDGQGIFEWKRMLEFQAQMHDMGKNLTTYPRQKGKGRKPTVWSREIEI